jgi:hypothetical protein
VVEKHRDSWDEYTGLFEHPLTIRDVFDGLFYSFNLKNFLISFFFLASIASVASIAGAVVINNEETLREYPVFWGITGFVLSMVLYYALDVMLYLISKNAVYRIKHGQNCPFWEMPSELGHDLRLVMFFSISFIVLFTLFIAAPAVLMKDGGLLFTGILSPIIVISVSVWIIILLLKNFLYAIMALRSRSLTETCVTLYRFVAVENINLPVYSIIICLLSLLFFSAPVFAIFAGTAALAMLFGINTGALFTHDSTASAAGLFDVLRFVIAGAPEGEFVIKFSIAIAAFFLFIILMGLSAWFVAVSQSLASISVIIMESNPGHSINRLTVLIGIAIYFFLMMVAAAFMRAG